MKIHELIELLRIFDQDDTIEIGDCTFHVMPKNGSCPVAVYDKWADQWASISQLPPEYRNRRTN